MKGRPSGLAASTQSYQKRNLKISRNIKSFVGSLDRNIGAPKYIASALRFFIWWVCFIVLQDWRKVRFEKKTPDLLRFKHCPKPNHRPKAQPSTLLFKAFNDCWGTLWAGFGEKNNIILGHYVGREGNKVAHNLARYARHITGYYVWMEDISVHCSNVYQADMP